MKRVMSDEYAAPPPPPYDCPMCKAKAPSNWVSPEHQLILINPAKPTSMMDGMYVSVFGCSACNFLALRSDDLCARGFD